MPNGILLCTIKEKLNCIVYILYICRRARIFNNGSKFDAWAYNHCYNIKFHFCFSSYVFFLSFYSWLVCSVVCCLYCSYVKMFPKKREQEWKKEIAEEKHCKGSGHIQEKLFISHTLTIFRQKNTKDEEKEKLMHKRTYRSEWSIREKKTHTERKCEIFVKKLKSLCWECWIYTNNNNKKGTALKHKKKKKRPTRK